MQSLLENDKDSDELNPVQSSSFLHDAEKKRENDILDQMENNLNNDTSPEVQSLKDTHNQFDYQASSASSSPKQTSLKLSGLLRKRFGIIGLITTLGLGGGLLISFFGPASMLINLAQNFGITNDNASNTMERRLFKVLNTAFKADSSKICASSNKIKCRQGRIGNNVLRKWAKKGIVPIRDGVAMKPGRTGYAKPNPTDFDIEVDGKTTRVPLNQMVDFLSQPENRKIADNFYGKRGAVNMSVRSWHGKHIKKRFFNKFDITRNGGIMSKAMKAASGNERLKNMKSKLTKVSDHINSVSDKISNKVKGKILKANKGAGLAYALPVAGCTLVKAPKFISAGVVAIQLAQILPIVTGIVLSSGSMLQATGIDEAAKIKPDDVTHNGDLLTKTTARESDGKQTSALDSVYLLSALGLVSKKLPLSEFVPGYSILNNPIFKASNQIDKATSDACNMVLSPMAMGTMATVSAALTLASSSTIIGPVIKLATEWVISVIAVAVAGAVIQDIAMAVLTEIAKNTDLENAEAEKLGDAIGIGATAFFAAGAMSRLLPGLSVGALPKAARLLAEQEEFQRQLDIASLSPLDTSSRYTFLGSIVNGLRNNMLQRGSYNNSMASILSNIVRFPASALSFSPRASAATGFNTETCNYAEEFDLTADSDASTPAINMAGLPCTGLTPEQDTMTMDEAIDILHGEGWIDKEADIPDGSTIDDLVKSGYIKPDTPMADYIETCGDAAEGNYIHDSAGCVMDKVSSGTIDSQITTQCYDLTDDKGTVTHTCYTDSEEYKTGSAPVDSSIKNPRAYTAIVIFLLDYQVSSILSGDDDDDGSDTNSINSNGSTVDSTADLPAPVGKFVSPIPTDKQSGVRMSAKYGRYPSGGAHWGVDLAGHGDNGWEFVSVCDGVVDSVKINSTYANKNAHRVSGSTNYVWIKCDNGIYMGYAHFYANRLKSYIKPGYRISAGTPIAPQGNQGNSSGPHLHFQVNPTSSSGYSASATRDPAAYLQQYGVSLPKPNY